MAGMEMLLSWSGLKDSIGTPISKYKLDLHISGWLDVVGMASSVICEVILFPAFLMMMAGGTAIIDFVTSPDRWLGPLQHWFETITSPVYSVFPPAMLASLALGITVLMMMVRRHETMSSKLGGMDLRRIGLGLMMVALVMAIMENPFSLVERGVNAIMDSVQSLLGGTEGVDASQAIMDSLIRPVTVAANFGTSATTPECLDAWSNYRVGKNPGFPTSTCVGKGAADAGVDSVFLLIVACIMAFTLIVLAVMALWKTLSHILMFMVLLAVVPFAIANSIRQHRMFEVPNRMLMSVIGHFIIASAVMALARVIPVLAGQMLVGSEWTLLGNLMAMIGVLGAGTVSIWWVSHKHGKLVQVLRADIGASLTEFLGVNPNMMISHNAAVQKLAAAQAAAVAKWDAAMGRGDGTPAEKAAQLAEEAGGGSEMARVLASTDGERGVESTRVFTGGMPGSQAVTTVISSPMGESDDERRAADEADAPVLDSPADDTAATAEGTVDPSGPNQSGEAESGAPPIEVNLPPILPSSGLRVDFRPQMQALKESGWAIPAPASAPVLAAPQASVGTPPSKEDALRSSMERFVASRSRIASELEGAGADTSARGSEDAAATPIKMLSHRSAPPPPRLPDIVKKVRGAAAQSPLPRLTALATARAKLDRERWLSRARGSAARFKIPDTSPMAALRFNDFGPRVSAAMDYGFGDLL